MNALGEFFGFTAHGVHAINIIEIEFSKMPCISPMDMDKGRNDSLKHIFQEHSFEYSSAIKMIILKSTCRASCTAGYFQNACGVDVDVSVGGRMRPWKDFSVASSEIGRHMLWVVGATRTDLQWRARYCAEASVRGVFP